MKKSSTYRKRVSQNTAVLVIVAALFLGFGTLRWALYQGVGDNIESCPKVDTEKVEGWAETDCTIYWSQFDTAEHNAIRSEALLCYTVAILLLTTSFIYKRHALAKE
jgi:hypothetical protein